MVNGMDGICDDDDGYFTFRKNACLKSRLQRTTHLPIIFDYYFLEITTHLSCINQPCCFIFLKTKLWQIT